MSLSDLDEDALERKFANLAGRTLSVHRFRTLEHARHYMKLRRFAEERTRAEFIAKGGLPVLRYPRYLVLGTSKWFCDWYIDKREIRIPLSCFDSQSISFTYPDCLISTLLAEDPKWKDRRKPYHGRVFTLEEVPDLVAEFGMPDEEDPKRFEIDEHLIEAQVWDMKPIQDYLSCMEQNRPNQTAEPTAPSGRGSP